MAVYSIIKKEIEQRSEDGDKGSFGCLPRPERRIAATPTRGLFYGLLHGFWDATRPPRGRGDLLPCAAEERETGRGGFEFWNGDGESCVVAVAAEHASGGARSEAQRQSREPADWHVGPAGPECCPRLLGSDLSPDFSRPVSVGPWPGLAGPTRQRDTSSGAAPPRVDLSTGFARILDVSIIPYRIGVLYSYSCSCTKGISSLFFLC